MKKNRKNGNQRKKYLRTEGRKEGRIEEKKEGRKETEKNIKIGIGKK